MSPKWIAGLAALAVGVGAFLWSRPQQNAGSKGTVRKSSWTRAQRLAGPLDHPHGLAVVGESVFVVTGGFAKADNAVLRVQATTGQVQKLASVPQVLFGELTVDDQHVYVTSEADGLILRVPQAGGEAEAIARARRPTYLAADEEHVYYAALADTGGALFRVKKTGGLTQTLSEQHVALNSVAVDPTHVFFRSNSGLWKVDKQTGAVVCLLPVIERRNLGRLVLDDTHVYFHMETEARGKYAVARLSKQGGPVETIGPVANLTARLALSPTHVYFFREVDLHNDALAKIPKAGGPPALVDGSGYSTGFLTVAQGDAYFSDSQFLYRVPK